MKKTIPLVMFLLAGMNMAIFSQTKARIINEIDYEQGLNPLVTSAIFQDRKGFVWISSYWQGSFLQRYDGYEFVTYDQIKNAVCTITQDQNGLLWFCSTNGFYVMDPETEKYFHYVPYHTFQSNAVWKIIKDTHGIYWCAAHYGLYRMVPREKNDAQLKELILEKGIESAFDIAVFKLNKTDTAAGANDISSIYEDSRQRLWVGGTPGLFMYDEELDEFIRMDDDVLGESRLLNTAINDIVEEDADVFWLHLNGGFTRISGISSLFSETNMIKTNLDFVNYTPDFMAGNYIKGFLMDDQKNIWFGTNYNGLIKMNVGPDYKALYEEVYPEMVAQSANLYEFVERMMIDRTGLLWVGHESGMIRKVREVTPVFAPLEELLKDDPPLRYSFNKMIEDSEGNLWVCNYESGIYKLSPGGKVTHYKIADPVTAQAGNSCISLLEVEKDIFWIGSWNAVWQLDAKSGSSKKLFDGSVIGLIYDLIKMEDDVLISSNLGGFWVYHLKTNQLDHFTADQNDSLGLKSNEITAFKRLRSGEIWVATANQGLTRMTLDTASGEPDFLPLPEAVVQNARTIIQDSKWINDIYEDSRGIMWFGTGNGLIRLNPVSGEIQRWTQKEGLCNDIIEFIEEDNNGNLWVAGTYGVSMINVSTGIIKTFDAFEGLPKVKNMHSSSYKDSKGLIYFGGLGGFYSINPDAVYQNNVIPPIVVTEFRLFNEPVGIDSTRKAILTKNIAYTQDIDLKYNQNDLSFTFAALDYNDPSKNKYAYILEGYQDEWTETDAGNRCATYTNLNPGNYVFRVKGSNNDGVWNEEGTFINITIHSPLWKTVWAYIVYGIILLLLIRGYIFWRTQRLRKEKIVLEKQVAERTADLKTANIKLAEHEKELETANTNLRKNQDELQEINTLLEEQKEELMQQKEELQSTLENLQKTQEQLVESEKMAAVGGLVAGVAHEMNTPVGIGITAISNLLDDVHAMAKRFEKNEISRDEFKDFLESSNDTAMLIQKNLERAASLVQSLKQVSTDQITEQQRVFAFKDYLNDILLSLRPKFRGKKLEFIIECDEELKLNSYPGIYAQIFTNLLLNSLQHGFYKKDTGSIKIKAAIQEELLHIQYIDDGEGISKKDLPHIFEPFYTSDQRKGTGLGLNIIYNLVKQKLHGTITCDSEPGKGVLFTIELPVK